MSANWSFPQYPLEPSYNTDNFGTNDDDELEAGKFENVRDHLLFIVDCSERMWHQQRDDGEPAVLEVLRTIVGVCRLNAVTGSKDFVGLLLYGVKDPKDQQQQMANGGNILLNGGNNADARNIKVMQQFGQASAETILQLMRLIEGGRELFERELGIGSDADLKMHLVIWEAQRMFQHKKLLGTKRVVLLTNNDNPHCGRDEMSKRSVCVRKFGDVNNSNILFEVFGLPGADGAEFDFSKFYVNVLPDRSGGGDDDQHSFQTYQNNLEMSQALRKKQFNKRSLAKTHLILSKDVSIAVSLYSMLLEAKKPAYKLADAVSLKQVETGAKYVRQDNQAQVQLKRAAGAKDAKGSSGNTYQQKTIPSGAVAQEDRTVTTKYGFPYGGEKIVFEEEEIVNIKGLFSEGIELLGFKPESFLKPYYSIHAPYFIYPDENRINGSTTIFAILLEQMHLKNVVALCRFQPRKGSMSRLAVLYPQLEELDQDGMQEKPPGFHVFLLPYADDIRHIVPSEPVKSVADSQIETFKKIINKFELTRYHPRRYRNPVLQSYYSVVEALALNLDDAEEWTDTIQPPIARLEKYKHLFDELTDGLADEPEPEAKPKARKKTSGEASKPAAKKRAKSNTSDSEADEQPNKSKRGAPKAKEKKGKKVSKNKYESDSDDADVLDASEEESDAETIDLDYWKGLHSKGKIGKMTVAELKDFLKSQGIKAAGKKADLVSQVEEYLSNL